MTQENRETETQTADGEGRAPSLADVEALHLVLIWARRAPERIGECCAVTRSALLGRASDPSPGDPPKIELARQRPGANEATGYLELPTLSRKQWRLSPSREVLQVENLGKRSLLHNGVAVDSCRAKIGDTVGVDGVALFLVDKRPRIMPRLELEPVEFGAPDRFGMVGETPRLWDLRRELRALAKGQAHVLIFGESGTGKELCARAIHRASSRSDVELVSRNAATIPRGLVEAELFGNAPNYPNAGMPARRGLVGLADGGILFLDEVGELEEAQQANLLRVLDDGEYQRLGEDRLRRSNLRMIAATNRSPKALKSDFLARFPDRLSVPGLNERRGDIPLLARLIMQRLAQEQERDSVFELSLELTDALVRHRYTLHLRELERIIRLAVRQSPTPVLELGDSVMAEIRLPSEEVAVSSEQIRSALAATKSTADAAKRLGLPSRYALYRLMKKLGIQQP